MLEDVTSIIADCDAILERVRAMVHQVEQVTSETGIWRDSEQMQRVGGKWKLDDVCCLLIHTISPAVADLTTQQETIRTGPSEEDKWYIVTTGKYDRIVGKPEIYAFHRKH